MYIYIYICMYINKYVYIYIYRERENCLYSSVAERQSCKLKAICV